MKFNLVPLGIVSLSSLILTGVPGFAPSASAQCVMTDVSVQTAIHGSRTPAQQTNDVTQTGDRRCVGGNSITSVGTQTYAGPGNVIQHRESHQSIRGSKDNVPPGVGGPTIEVPVGIKTDVYSPAYDPSFMRKLKVNL